MPTLLPRLNVKKQASRTDFYLCYQSLLIFLVKLHKNGMNILFIMTIDILR